VAVGELGVGRGARELSGLTDFIQDSEHHHDGLRTALLLETPDGFDLDVQHRPPNYEISFILRRLIGKSYHIYRSIFLYQIKETNGGNMMSVAYDYSRETVAPVSSSKPRLLLIDGRQVPSLSGRSF